MLPAQSARVATCASPDDERERICFDWAPLAPVKATNAGLATARATRLVDIGSNPGNSLAIVVRAHLEVIEVVEKIADVP
jgi:hypothetical protein